MEQALEMVDTLISVFATGLRKKRQGIMFMGGSFNPVHSQHVRLMEVVKEYFEREHDLNVTAGYLVITTYVHH